MALNLAQVEQVHAALARLPALVDQLQQRSTTFFDGMLEWLKQAEQLCEAHRLPAAGEFAVLRTRLLQAARSQLPAGLVIAGRPTRRKMRDAAASQAAERGEEVLRGHVQRREQQLADGEALAGQIAAVARVKGHVRQCAGQGSPEQRIVLLRQLIENDPDLLSAHTQLVGLLGRGDALAVLDRAVPDL
jgi:hypothetical protein